MNIYQNIIIGAGASGLMLAHNLKNKNFIIIEKNSEIGAKLKISGGGKCNITNKNISYLNYNGDKNFITYILNKFTNIELINFLKKNKISPILLNKFVNGQYFLNSSDEILNIFKKQINKKNIKLNCNVLDINKKNNLFTVKTSKGNFISKNLIIATGGKSYGSIGATDIGYKIAKQFNHNITPLDPALTGYTVNKTEQWFKNLSGISLNATVSFEDKKFNGNILFSHKGITGPAIFFATIHRKKGNIYIDFMPNKDINFNKHNKKHISSSIELPKRFVKEFLKISKIKDQPLNSINDNEKKELLNQLKNYKFAPSGTFGFSRAEVTKGGINISEINKNSMMSKIITNLFFLGELLDVTGEVGGYNLQWAFSTAVTCANFLNNIKEKNNAKI